MMIAKMQLGKNGLTENFIGTLKNAFKTHEIVRISVHQYKEQTKQNAEEIINKLGKNYTYKIIGFTIAVKKWRKNKR